MSTSSKRKKAVPKKFKSRKFFASGNDLLEEPEFSRPRDEDLDENPQSPSQLSGSPQKDNFLEESPISGVENFLEINVDGSVSTPRKRGRGRPRKGDRPPPVFSPNRGGENDGEPQNGAVTPHRGRGRPKGSTKVKSNLENVPKRSRGRPKGSKSTSPSLATIRRILGAAKKVNRGSGRPRGRPRKIQDGSEILSPKRGRGRPRGRPRKDFSASRKMLGSVMKVGRGRPRGRPRKIQDGNEILTPKRGRGRPRKNQSTASSARRLTLLTSPREGKKRGRPRAVRPRGRPRKILLHSPIDPLAPKRPRGRPRTRELLPPAPVTESSLLTEPHEVRKRGRPRKIVVYSEEGDMEPSSPKECDTGLSSPKECDMGPPPPKRPRGRPRTKSLLPPPPAPVTEPETLEEHNEESDGDRNGDRDGEDDTREKEENWKLSDDGEDGGHSSSSSMDDN